MLEAAGPQGTLQREGTARACAQSPPLAAPEIRCQLPATLSWGWGLHTAPWLSECAGGSEEAPRAGA